MRKNWYALATRLNHERRVAHSLAKKEFEVYCPTITISKSAQRKKSHESVLFPFVFVRASEDQFNRIMAISGVKDFFYWLGRPAVIRDVEIDMIRHFLLHHHMVMIQKTEVNMNEMGRISTGPLIENEHNEWMVDDGKIRLYLPGIGYLLTADKAPVPDPVSRPLLKKTSILQSIFFG